MDCNILYIEEELKSSHSACEPKIQSFDKKHREKYDEHWHDVGETEMSQEMEALKKTCSARFDPAELERRIAVVKKKAHSAKQKRQGKDLTWSLNNWGNQLQAEAALSFPCRNIVAVWQPKPGDGAFVAVKLEPSVVAIVSVEETYMKMHFTEAALQGLRYRDTYNSPQKLHFQSELDKVTPRKARMDKAGKWSIMTQDGDNVEVSEKYVKDLENMGGWDYEKIKGACMAQIKGGMEPAFFQLSEGHVKGTASMPAKETAFGSALAAGGVPMVDREGEQRWTHHSTQRFGGWPAADQKQIKIEHQAPWGDHFCMARSIAALLHALGHPEAACQFLDDAVRRIEASKINRVQIEMVEHVRASLKALHIGMRVTKDRSFWKTQGMFLVSLRGSKGGLNHAVSIAGGLVYDSNQTWALPLSAESLDAVCGGSGFGGFLWVRELIIRKKCFLKQSKQEHHD